MSFRRIISIASLALAIQFSDAPAQQVLVDLNNWTAEDLTAGGTWLVQGTDTARFTLTSSHSRSVFYSDFNVMNLNLRVTLNVNQSADDDYIGLVLGFRPGDSTNTSSDYLLIDWKQTTQNVTGQGYSPAGLAVSRVTGPGSFASNGGSIDYWSHVGDVTELARATNLGSTGWVDFTDYVFDILLTPTHLKVYVDGFLEFDLPGTYQEGRFGCYNFSQAETLYKNIQALGLSGFPAQISLSAGGVQDLVLTGGPNVIGQLYLILGSVTGTSPGLPLGANILPLNADTYFMFTLENPNTGLISNSLSTLDAVGMARAQFTIPAGTSPLLAGLVVHHAYLVLDSGTFQFLMTSNAVPVQLVM